MRTLVVFLLLLAPVITLADTINAGFVQGIWFSQYPVFAGDTVRVYVAVRNNTDTDLSGRVSFYDNEERFERMNINALSGRIVEGWADWTATYGEHTLSADLTKIELETIGTDNETATVTSALAETTVFIDYDTDGDDIGNTVDEDDDGDGISDEDEEEAGTDPLEYDEPVVNEDDEDEDEEGEENEGEEETGGGEAAAQKTTNSNSPQGLEQYLTDSRARAAIASLTETTNTAKEKLDEYRASRQSNDDKNEEEETGGGEAAASKTTDDDLIVISDSGEPVEAIGEITREQGANPAWWQGALGKAFSGLQSILNTAYSLILTGLSFALAHPLVLQIILLIIILYTIFRTAQRLAKRPS